MSQFDGIILKQEKLPFSPDAAKDVLIDEIIAKVRAHSEEFSERRLLGIGIGEPAHDPTYYHGDHSKAADRNLLCSRASGFVLCLMFFSLL